MERANLSRVIEFELLGLTSDPWLQRLLFMVFLGMYAITLLGNLIMFIVIHVEATLHTPVYSLLESLSFLDFCYSSTVVPQTLVNFFTKRKVISYPGCMAQMIFCAGFATSECYLVAAMAYNRYAAICNPLLYSTAMSPEVCASLIVGSYSAGFPSSLIHMSCIFSLKFCGAHVVTQFFCDGPSILPPSCVDTSLCEILLFIFAGFNLLSCTLTILVSYLFILVTILRRNSAQGRFKAFSTCASHFTAVCLFYGTTLFMYLRPRSSHSLTQDRMVAVIYTVVIPMLNPLIYSLRNKDVKEDLRNVWGRKIME
ncbi:LOW QUALITY PROTEIN: olfactory receptor 5AU1 [Physeter macrocephalus]|uniref:Olfactory receptor n=1 Tax=Physeter macrocephalus TaxID=9755 RepID=A0A2Y9SD51_PHYMC|nr:LOW QUALITY PROTEIN: olfactory receptor 5AU1 [Physeter catodon]|eukprot:XP_023974230.1 LOW QUALITY PROTEIN: olfactory receptor 5AU1 [Physeter catodon]